MLSDSFGPAGVEVGVGESEAGRESASFEHTISSIVPRDIWQNWKRSAQPNPSCFEEARERLRQLEAACCAQESGCVLATPLGLGDPSPESINQLQEEGPVERPRVRQRLSMPHVVEDTIPPRAQRVDGRPSARYARGHVVRKSEEVVGVDVPSRPGRRDDRRHGSMMSSRHHQLWVSCRVGEATHPGPSVLRSNL